VESPRGSARFPRARRSRDSSRSFLHGLPVHPASNRGPPATGARSRRIVLRRDLSHFFAAPLASWPWTAYIVEWPWPSLTSLAQRRAVALNARRKLEVDVPDWILQVLQYRV